MLRFWPAPANVLGQTQSNVAENGRADFVSLQREENETAEDVGTRILQIEKNCEFDNVTPAELIASKFLSIISKPTSDYELKRKHARATWK